MISKPPLKLFVNKTLPLIKKIKVLKIDLIMLKKKKLMYLMKLKKSKNISKKEMKTSPLNIIAKFKNFKKSLQKVLKKKNSLETK
jgi:hypothetical protein